ncbi:hypothetical protein H0H87_004748 [Tephrocybe sp. NHM501043]|nr:hypothetical protein H0H87_004748 [Tephrocybe sp. NHM501043]
MATNGPTTLDEKSIPVLGDEKTIDSKPSDLESDVIGVDTGEFNVLENERDIATNIITVADDPSLNPWTIRAFVIGIGLSAFGGVLVSTMFLAIISYVLGMGMAAVIPTQGLVGRYLNPVRSNLEVAEDFK